MSEADINAKLASIKEWLVIHGFLGDVISFIAGFLLAKLL